MSEQKLNNSYIEGLKDGLPIGLGYLSVSFTFGITAVLMGFDWWQATLISMTNLTSAGQFAGLPIIAACAPMIEMALTQLVINLRYALMSLSLSQKLDSRINALGRALIAFSNTDEIFAVASGKKGVIGMKYMLGLITLPYIGWSLGTFLGARAGDILPDMVTGALSIAIYAMFIAIVIPPVKKQKSLRFVTAAAAVLACAFYFVPLLKNVSSGFVVIICTVVCSAIGAVLFPVKEEKESE